MNQYQQPWPWRKDTWKDHWPIAVLIATVLVIFLTGLLGVWRSWERSFWDWLGLLIIPVVLGLGGIWFNNQTRKTEQEIAQDRVREEALQRYLDRMQELILDKSLKKSGKDAEIRNVARARTLAVLRSLDGNRKGHVVRFLHESELIGRLEIVEEPYEELVREAIVELRDADLSNVYLEGAFLLGVDLSFANLSNADLHYAVMDYCTLVGANLSNADVRAPLSGNLRYVNLSGADLRGAMMHEANLYWADLSEANLSGAQLMRANLRRARNCTNQQLAQAESLVGATMPDGTKMTEVAWEEFKKRRR
jgi:uncharacterized protein YjbI with pentapeptide repeats